MDASKRGVVAAAFLAIAPTAFAQSADSILSRHVREADGVSGQVTNDGSGIKTGHLQDGAVTAAKIAGASVGPAQLADGAVTDAKIAGPISGAKISSAGLDADTLDGLHAGGFSVVNHGHEIDHVFQLPEELATRPKQARNVIVVSKDGEIRDPSAAAAAITDASAANPYLIRVMPGVYDLTSPVVLPQYVHLEGSGRGVTVIRGSGAVLDGWGFVVRTDAGEAEIRALTIVSDGVQSALGGTGRFINLEVLVGGTFQPGCNAVGINLSGGEVRDVRIVVQPMVTTGWAEGFSVNAPSPVKLSDLDVTVLGPDGAAGLGIEYNTVVQLTNARFNVTGVGVAHGISPGTIDARNVVLSVAATGNPANAFGIHAAGDSIVANSSIDAGSAGVALGASGRPSTFLVSGSKLVGQFSNPWGDAVFRCFGNFDAAYVPANCPAP